MSNKFTYSVHTVTLVIKTPSGSNPPSEWDWPSLIDCQDDEVEFVSEEYIGESEVIDV